MGASLLLTLFFVAAQGESPEPAPAEPAPAEPAPSEPAVSEPAVSEPTTPEAPPPAAGAVDVAPGQVTLVNGIVADAMQEYEELKVLTASDIRRIADFEADKQAVGCEESSCLAEIAGAMGAAYVVYGQVGMLGDELVVQLNLFDASTGTAVAREDLRVASMKLLADRLPWTVGKLVAPLAGREPPPPPVDETPPSMMPSVLLWSGVGAAAVGALAGAGAGIGAAWAWSVVTSSETTAAAKNDAQPLGVGLVGVAGAGGLLVAVGGGLIGASFVVGE
jgi:hypothetical protein